MKIMQDLLSNSEDKFYDFEDYKIVLATGTRDDSFKNIPENDFNKIINLINFHYNDCNNHINNSYLRGFNFIEK